MAIFRHEILKGREFEYPLSSELETNLSILLVKLNTLRMVWGKPMIVSSGYRPGRFNKAPYTGSRDGAKRSAHITCQAADIRDPDQALSSYLIYNPKLLPWLGLYMEDPKYTPTWCHLDCIERGDRHIFKPY